MNPLTIIIIAIFIATLFNILAKKLSLPTILGYIFTGLAIASLYHIQPKDQILLNQISEFGIVFLMFTIGLEFSIKILSSMKKEVFVFGFLQLFITSLAFGLIGYYLFGIDLKGSIIIASSLSLSSTAIVIKMLNEKGDLQRQYGRKALGILLFQDIAVIPLLLMITIFTNSQSNIAELLWKISYGAIAVGFTIYFIGKYLLNYILTLVTTLKSYEIFISTLLFIVIGSSLMAHLFGFSYSLGAFMAGMMISETKFKHQIEADMIPFRDILLGIFFISVGMQIRFQLLLDNFFTVAGLTIAILAVKAVLLYFVLLFFTQKRTALKTALSLSQIGEFSIVLLSLASSNRLLQESLFQILLIATIISMIISPFIINNVRFLADILKDDEEESELKNFTPSNINNHIVVCGYGRVGKIVCSKLSKKGLKFIVVEHDIKLVKEAIEDGFLALFGNAAMQNIQDELQLKNAICAIITIENEEKLFIVSESFRAYSQDLHIIVNIKDIQMAKLLKDSADHILFEPENTAKLLVDEAVTCPQKSEG